MSDLVEDCAECGGNPGRLGWRHPEARRGQTPSSARTSYKRRIVTVAAENREDALLLAQAQAEGGIARKIIKHRAEGQRK